MKPLPLLTLPLLLAVPLAAQTTNRQVSSPPRDAQTISVIQRALAALGGADLQATTVSGSVFDENGQPTGQFTWSNCSLGFRAETNDADGIHKMVITPSGGERKENNTGGVARLYAHQRATFLIPYLPAQIFRRAVRDEHVRIESLSTIQIDGREVAQVKIVDESTDLLKAISKQTWSFDTTSGLPVGVDYLVPDRLHARKTAPASYKFADYRSVSGIAIPFEIANFLDSHLLTTFKLISLQTNTNCNPEDFALSAKEVQ